MNAFFVTREPPARSGKGLLYLEDNWLGWRVPFIFRKSSARLEVLFCVVDLYCFFVLTRLFQINIVIFENQTNNFFNISHPIG